MEFSIKLYATCPCFMNRGNKKREAAIPSKEQSTSLICFTLYL